MKPGVAVATREHFAARITGAICCHRMAYNSYIDKRLGS